MRRIHPIQLMGTLTALRCGDLEVLTDFSGGPCVDLSMPRYCCYSTITVHIDRVIGPLPQQVAAIVAKVSNQIAMFHEARRIGSTTTSSTGDSAPSPPPRVSNIRASASLRFSRASFKERPWLIAPGTSSTRAAHQPSHRRYTAVNVLSIASIIGQQVLLYATEGAL